MLSCTKTFDRLSRGFDDMGWTLGVDWKLAPCMGVSVGRYGDRYSDAANTLKLPTIP